MAESLDYTCQGCGGREFNSTSPRPGIEVLHCRACSRELFAIEGAAAPEEKFHGI